MDKRTQAILEATVREFIEVGEPVSSDWLYGHYNFGIKPAMIRFELNDLTRQGLLDQPHHSAGRIPTDRGYEFFADRMLEEEKGQRYQERLLRLCKERAWPELLAWLSRELGVLGVLDDFEGEEIYKDGLEQLIDHLEWDSHAILKGIVRDFEELDRRLERTTLSRDNVLKVFIGRKSPITKSEHLSVIAGDYDVDGSKVLLFAIGPKRMDYERAASVFWGLKNVCKHHGGRE